MKNPESIQALVALIQKNGVVTLPAGIIRTALGYQRLGCHVVNDISQQLNASGIAHYPDTFPSNQYTFVRLVMVDSPYDELLQACLNPSPKNDGVLQKYVTHVLLKDEVAKFAKRVQELVPTQFIDEDIPGVN
jgi:hypothetical protein